MHSTAHKPFVCIYSPECLHWHTALGKILRSEQKHLSRNTFNTLNVHICSRTRHSRPHTHTHKTPNRADHAVHINLHLNFLLHTNAHTQSDVHGHRGAYTHTSVRLTGKQTVSCSTHRKRFGAEMMARACDGIHGICAPETLDAVWCTRTPNAAHTTTMLLRTAQQISANMCLILERFMCAIQLCVLPKTFVAASSSIRIDTVVPLGLWMRATTTSRTVRCLAVAASPVCCYITWFRSRSLQTLYLCSDRIARVETPLHDRSWRHSRRKVGKMCDEQPMPSFHLLQNENSVKMHAYTVDGRSIDTNQSSSAAVYSPKSKAQHHYSTHC